jgi:large subunit ribosomal protein L5
MTRLRERYNKQIVPSLTKKFGYSNAHQVPRLVSVIVSVGTGRVDDEKTRDIAIDTLRRITGQQPAIRRAKKSIASFKLREGQVVGLQVTLRGARMENFLDKLINVTLPRVRDFRGINPQSFDGHGNYSLGLKEQNVFPEVPFDQVEKTHGIQITITTSALTNKEGRALLDEMGMPFAKSAAELKQAEEMTAGEDRASLLAHAKAKAAKTATAGEAASPASGGSK